MPRFLALGTGILGGTLLLLAAFLPWFRVPMADATGGLAGVEPHVTFVLKVLGLFVAGGSALIWRRTRCRASVARGLTLLFVALLFFPYLVMVWSPREAAQASWLQTQHESLAWLGGDIFGEQESKGRAGKSEVRMTLIEVTGEAIRLPRAASTAQVSWLPELLECFGYSNRFCQFANRGWFLALGGTLLVLVALCRAREGFQFSVFRTITRSGLAGLGIGVAVALTPIFIAGALVARSRTAAQQGDPAAAWRWLHRAALVLPALRQDADLLARRGLLENSLGMPTAAAALHRATVLDRQGFAARAQTDFVALLADAPPGSAVQRAAGCALLRSGIQALNSGQTEVAAALLDSVLAVDPSNVKALYALQLACLRAPRPDRLPALVARTDAAYRFFSTRTKAPVVAAAYENAALAAQGRGQTDEALALRRISLGRPR